MTPELIIQLDEMQKTKNRGLGVETIRGIIFYLKKGDIEKAKVVWSWDGDKIRQYPDLWDFLITHLGCRTHGIINCDKTFCQY